MYWPTLFLFFVTIRRMQNTWSVTDYYYFDSGIIETICLRLSVSPTLVLSDFFSILWYISIITKIELLQQAAIQQPLPPSKNVRRRCVEEQLDRGSDGQQHTALRNPWSKSQGRLSGLGFCVLPYSLHTKCKKRLKTGNKLFFTFPTHLFRSQWTIDLSGQGLKNDLYCCFSNYVYSFFV
jgi:hypothetical protein